VVATRFNSEALRELTDQQVRFAPPARRAEQLARAEKLIGEIDPDRPYPYQFVCFRLTDFRSDAHADLLIRGSDLRHDLAVFAQRVERSLPPLPVALYAEPMLTLDEVSRQFNVSTKTVCRWRMDGLVARRVVRDGRKQLGFPESAVAAFAAAHRSQVERGGKFSRLTAAEQDGIIRTARELAAGGNGLTEASRAIATRLGRSTEAVRYTIKNFDRAHPDAAVFPDHHGPLDAAARATIVAARQEGSAVKLLATQFGRSRGRVYGLQNAARAERLLAEPVEFIPSPEFDDPAREAAILAPMPDEEAFFAKVKSMRPPKDVEAHMAYLYERPLLSREQEAHLFRKMNFRKHQLKKLQSGLDPARAKVADLNRYEEVRADARRLRDILIECNQRLVHSLATKHLQPGQSLDELKSDANLSLMRAVEKFDYGRGFKFSTYATWAIMKNFARSIPDENTRKSRYLTGTDELFDGKADVRTDEGEIVAQADQARNRVNRLLEYLDPRTREVIKMRQGIGGSEEMTLEQIGQHFGITKERVRQINVRGMKMLREKAAQENVELG
jgi:RNA polymerase sigma factor (sigma-70 family)